MTKEIVEIYINIWDDFADGNDTYAYIEMSEEDGITNDFKKKVLELLLTSINSKFPNLSCELFFYDTALKYPHFVGTENESLLFKRWEIRFKKFSKEKIEILVNYYNNKILKVNGKEMLKLVVYSES